jgi:antitoxin VapB
MSKEHIGKSFKSGNSVAIRIPAALGVEPDREWTIERIDGELRLRERTAEPGLIDLTGIYGRGAGLKLLTPEDRLLEERELDWTGARLPRSD